MDDTRERLADLCHKQWSGWMKYLFKMSSINSNREAVIPSGLVIRWKRQMNTNYEDLSEEEKDSDRDEADRFIKIINSIDNKS